MPMSKEEHEALLNELLSADLEHSRRTEILQQLRVDYSTVQTDFEELTATKTKLESDNMDLVLSNSKLFRQLGVTGDKKLEEQEQTKDFSESVTIESLEKGVN